MKRQPGSGAKSGAKSDLVAPGDRRIEMKETTAKSFTLKLEHLMKVEAEAGGARERPILSIEFQGVHPFQRYHVIPDWAFRSLLDELDSLKGGTL